MHDAIAALRPLDKLELLSLAEMVTGRPDRITGSGLFLIRDALGFSRHELAVKLETTEREIERIERGRKAIIPEKMDLRIRKLFLER